MVSIYHVRKVGVYNLLAHQHSVRAIKTYSLNQVHMKIKKSGGHEPVPTVICIKKTKTTKKNSFVF